MVAIINPAAKRAIEIGPAASARLWCRLVERDTPTRACKIQRGGQSGQSGDEGSGVILRSDGTILTNNHVIEAAADGAGTITVKFNNGKTAPATIVGRDPGTDLAVIKTTGVSGLTPTTLATSSTLHVGDTVQASADAREAALYLFAPLAALYEDLGYAVPTLLVRGNHDDADRTSALSLAPSIRARARARTHIQPGSLQPLPLYRVLAAPPAISAVAQVKLCDAVSGGFSHHLVGHREPVWAACWSPTSEWHLVTGGCDGQVWLRGMMNAPRSIHPKRFGGGEPSWAHAQVRYWDIRQSGCLHVFDQHATKR